MQVDSNSALSISSVSEDVLGSLHRSVSRFVDVDEAVAGREDAYHLVAERMHRVCFDILRCERAGYSREDIIEVMAPAREIVRRSPFISRLQDWPRGYPGDFETVEYLCSGRSRVEADDVADLCEQFSLTRAIAQQHRNKVQHQAARIARTLAAHPGTARVFSFACGSCPDFRQLEERLHLIGELWLNDGDPAALEFSSRALSAVKYRSHYRPGNALKIARRAVQNHQQFDLVMAGGLFDYLPDKQAAYLIEQARHLLAPGGVFFFTNIAAGNPYRVLIEYFGDWFLIERSEEDIVNLCAAAGVYADDVRITRDETGLALLIEVRKGSEA
jgi:SAM-dependent methyltransferase